MWSKDVINEYGDAFGPRYCKQRELSSSRREVWHVQRYERLNLNQDPSATLKARKDSEAMAALGFCPACDDGHLIYLPNDSFSCPNCGFNSDMMRESSDPVVVAFRELYDDAFFGALLLETPNTPSLSLLWSA